MSLVFGDSSFNENGLEIIIGVVHAFAQAISVHYRFHIFDWECGICAIFENIELHIPLMTLQQVLRDFSVQYIPF